MPFQFWKAVQNESSTGMPKKNSSPSVLGATNASPQSA